MGCALAQLANMTELSMCGDDVAFLSNYFDHLLMLFRWCPCFLSTKKFVSFCYNNGKRNDGKRLEPANIERLLHLNLLSGNFIKN